MKNNKGFTMVEILAAIVIMGLLTTIAIVSVSSVINKAEKNHYKTQEKNMIMAAKSYSQDNRNFLPKEIGGSKIIMLSELQNRKYIGDVLDRSKMVCNNGSLDAGGSYVEIFRYSKDGYSYRPYLKCRKYETGKEEYGGEGPDITLTMTKNYDNPSFSFEITDTEGKIISYNYVIYKYELLVRDSGSIPVSKVGSIPKKEVSLKDLIPGEFKIVFTATNMYGKQSVETITGNILDENGPTCTNIQPVYGDWQKVPEVTITANCVDNSGSGCAREIYSQVFREDIKIGIIEMTDNLGNKGNCEVGVYIDNTPPTKPIVNNPYEDTWINKSYSIEVKSTDVTSGVEYFEYRYPDSSIPEEREWKIYEGSRRGENVEAGEFVFNTPNFTQERGEYVEFRACDQVENCSETTKSMIKIDKTPPTCVSSGGSDTWKNVTVTLLGTCSENKLSGCAGNITKDYATDINTTNQTPGTVKDVAGNATECPADQTVKVDKTKPVVSFRTDYDMPGNYDDNSGVTAGGSCYDPNVGTTGSGIASENLGPTHVSSPNYNKSVKFTCTDVAGNVGSKTGSYYVRYYSSHSACGVKEYYSCEAEACGAKTCATSGCGVKEYNSCSEEACGVELYNYCPHSECGTYCSAYNSKQSGSTCGWGGIYCTPGFINSTNTKSCSWSDTLHQSCCRDAKTCSDASFGCKTYSNNSCRTSGCGVYAYKICATAACGVKYYKTCAHAECGYYTCATAACGVKSYYSCWHY